MSVGIEVILVHLGEEPAPAVLQHLDAASLRALVGRRGLRGLLLPSSKGLLLIASCDCPRSDCVTRPAG